MRRLIIDTDTASDDAVALVMALRASDVQVEAITVVAGNVPVDQGVQNALYTAELCGARVPVYRGRERPLLRPLDTATHVHGLDGMGDIGLELSGRTPAPGRAADALVELFTASPGEISLVTLGPLSNVAAALLRAPELAACVAHCTVMGGSGYGPGNVTPVAEFNIWVDPEAAAVVLASGMPLTLVGWDISMASAHIDTARAAELRAIGTPLAHFAVDIQRCVTAFMKGLGIDGFDLPDPIAMAVALDPSIAEIQPHPVEIVTGDGPCRGQTLVDRFGVTGRPANAGITRHVPEQRFLSALRAALH